MLCEAEPLIDGFQEFVLSHARQEKPDTDQLIEKIKLLRAMQAEACMESDHLLKAGINSLCVQHVRNAIAIEFPLLDPALFLKKRYVGVAYNGKEQKAEVVESHLEKRQDMPGMTYMEMPLFVSKSHCHNLGWSDTPSRPRIRLTLKAAFPGEITMEEQLYGYKAEAVLLRACAALLEHKETAAFVNDMLFKGGYYQGRPQFDAYWIPTIGSLSVTAEPVPAKRDPALVMEWNGDRYLCCFWDAANERPLEALIREFSSGGKVHKTRKK